MEFHPYDWNLSADTNENKTNIHCWCFNRNSEACLVRITGFPVSCYIQLPDIEWTAAKRQSVSDYISFVLKEDAPQKVIYTEKENLYYYRNNKKNPYLFLLFNTQNQMKHLDRILKKKPANIRGIGEVKLTMLEQEISSVRKFLTTRNLEYSQWFSISKFTELQEDEKISSCGYEYTCNWNNINPIDNSLTQSWMVKPKILAIDIECYSNNFKAMPNALSAPCVAYMISCISYKLHDKNSVKNYAVLFGQCNPVKNAEIIQVGSEIDLIREFEKLVVRLDPDIIIGYNIFGFDYKYLDDRLKRKLNEWGITGRLVGVPSRMENRSWASSGFGINVISNLSIPGRINIDLLPIMRRGFRLDMYNLDFVSNHFLGKGKHPIKAEEMFRIYEYSLNNPSDQKALDDMTRVMEYCLQDSILVIELFEKIDVWNDITQQSSILGVNLSQVFTSGQQVKCVSQIYHECSLRGIVMDHQKQENFQFEGGYVAEPVAGLHENIICLDFASMYPSIIEASNISFETLVAPEYEKIIPDELCHVYSIDSKILEEITAPEEDNENEQEIQPEIEKPKIYKKYNFKFVKAEVKKGVLPIIVRKLVDERRAVKKKQEETTDPLIYNVLEKRQNALKISANSMFGFLGARESGKLPLIQAAVAITWRGRADIEMVNKFLLDNYNAKIVYNDTDSVFVDCGIKDPKDCFEFGIKIAAEITKLFPPPSKIEFEKSMRILNLKKKKYAAYFISKEGAFVDKKGKLVKEPSQMFKRGILSARRDNNVLMRKIYDNCLFNILQRNDLRSTLKILFSGISDLFSGKIPAKDLTIIRELNSHYKSENYFMKVFQEELRKRDKLVSGGDRIQFLLIHKPEEEFLGKRMILLEEFLENENQNYQLDYLHYLGLLINPLEQLLTIAYAKEFSELEWIRYEQKRKKIKMTKFLCILREMLNEMEINTAIKILFEQFFKKRPVLLEINNVFE